MHAECKTEHRPHQFTLSVRFQAPTALLSQEFGRAFATISRYLAESGAPPTGPAYAVYHDMDLAKLDVEAGFLVDRPLAGAGEVHAGSVPDGEVATTIHTGPYQALGDTYNALNSWMHGRGLTAAGPPCELYLNDPVTTPAAELKTKVIMPIEAA